MRLFRVGFVSVTAMVAAGCGGDSPTDVADASVPAAEASTTTSVPDMTTPTSAAPATTTVPAAPSTAAAPATTTPACTIGTAPTSAVTGALSCTTTATAAPPPVTECLTGVWDVSAESMYNILVETTLANLPFDASISGPGSLSLLADGSYVWAPHYIVSVETGELSTFGLITGSVVGTWSAAEDRLTMIVETNSQEIAMDGGQVIDSPPFFDGDLEIVSCTDAILDVNVPAPIGTWSLPMTRAA